MALRGGFIEPPSSGVLCGVKLERYHEGGWRVERML